MTKRMTKKEMFAVIAETINAVEVENKAEMLNFIDHEIDTRHSAAAKSLEGLYGELTDLLTFLRTQLSRDLS